MLRPVVFRSAIAGALLALAAPAAAEITQSGWIAAKQAQPLSNGVTLRVIELGDPAAPAVLLIHGFTDTSRSWSTIAPLLAKYRLIIPDLRGHGGSDKPECCYAIGDLAHDLKLLLDTRKIDRAHVVGHSLGSIVAQRLAADHPERVDRLVLIGSTGLPAVARGDWLWSNVMALRDPIDPRSAFIGEWVSGATPIDPQLLDAVRPETVATPINVWRSVARELAVTSPGRLAGEIKAPTMILWGDKDSAFGPGAQAELRRALPDARFTAFAGQGHNLHWERPDAVAEAITAFLQ
jgi:pimeloyl-ACP methyl ester carboxylesterase